MTAIYKRELKSYLTSMVGYLFIFFILVLTGIYFSAYQLSAAYPKFEYTLSAITFAFLIGVPILTMRVLAEERKQKTDQLLLTAPISVWDIVFGKYLALVAVFAIPVVIMCFYPLIMSKFGTISYASAYTGILGFFLLGCANLAIGVFMSALTESQVISSTYFCISVCFLYDEWNFLIFLTDFHVNGSGIRTSDRGDRNYHLYHDQKCSDLCSDRSCRRSCPCDRIRCKIKYFPGWYPESTECI